MMRWALILLAVAWPMLGTAQAKASVTATGVGTNPELRAYANGIKDPAHARTLGLGRLDVAVDVRGAVAETTVEAAFANPTNEVLEGDFRLQLPPGALVTGYALDIDGRVVVGVLMDRPRARAVYNERVRRGIDPGVAEVTPENLFRTSVYPVPADRGRVVRVRFALPIPVNGYRLPLRAAGPGEARTVRVRVNGVAVPPVVSPAGELVVARPAFAPWVVSRHRTGEEVVQLGGSLPVSAAPEGSSAARGERLRIYWDRSRAHGAADTAAEIDVVRQVVERLRPAGVELVAFNSSGAERTTVATGEAAAAWLAARRYRGATSYAPLAGDGPTDRCLLFATGGPVIDRAQGFAPRCRLDAVSSAASADRSWLRHAAGGHGGTALSLEGGNAASVVAALVDGAGAGRVVAVTDRDGRALPFLPLDAAPGQWLVLARRPAGGPVLVSVSGGSGSGGEPVVLRVAPPASDGAEAGSFDAPAALLAADRLAALGATEQRAAFVEQSQRYGIASPSLSFLVLETPDDYLAAKIEPPASYPAERRDAYFRARKNVDARRAERERQWLDQVATRWNEAVTWWQAPRDPKAKPKRIATSQAFDRTAPTSVAAPMAAGSAMSPAVADGARVDLDSVVITGSRIPEASVADPSTLPPAMPPPPPPPAPAPIQGEAVAVARVSESTGPGSGGPTATGARIQIDPWQPDRPYLELFDGKPADFDERFLEAQARHGQLPVFYLDTAEWLRRHGRGAEAGEMVLSALDLPAANEVTLGIVADRLERYNEIDRAIELRERQMALDPDRPQPRRLLALALARRATVQPAMARTDLERAVGLLYEVATTPLDGPWDGIETIALTEANALLPRLRRLGGRPPVAMDPRLVRLLDTDVRVVIDWTTEGSDMDLWVDEPSGERAIYNHARTVSGGHLSRDMTRGYGPEEYWLRRAPGGTYLVQANVYAPDRLDPNGATHLTAHLFHNFGRPDEREESVDIEVTRDDKGAKTVGRLEVGGERRR